MQKIFDGMEHPGAPINDNFNELNNQINKDKTELHKDHAIYVNTNITGYKSGGIIFSRRGDMVIASFAVELSEIKVNWNIIHCPDGYKPTPSANGLHVALVGGLELKLNKQDFASQDDANNRWWVGQAMYFTDDPFPA